ncbi:hypothetical protein Acr_15g0013630 [Actinidia rufa]|uniref:Uncharacterized protein n=1 Tax=Actinidia rufa TaxID=165716 RepID=A0A7J0FVP9_9ERIC|nr:hypothetical protein Acr_15g0013630 [Actinidia rufa]
MEFGRKRSNPGGAFVGNGGFKKSKQGSFLESLSPCDLHTLHFV